MLRWLNRAGSTMLLLAVVFLPPVAAVLWAAGQDWRWPTGTQLGGWLRDPPAEFTVIVLVGAAATGLWLLVTVVVARTLARHVVTGWRRLRRMPLPTPAQATAGSLAGTALLGLPATTITLAQPDPAPPAGTGQDSGGAHEDHRGHPAPDTSAGAAPGIELPDGGWLPAGTAQQVAAMTSLFWMRRRHTYQPAPGETPTEKPGPELPVAAAAITARADTAAAEPVRVDELPAATIALTGAGAYAAARGLLVTALMTPSPAGVLITRGDWRALLGDDAPTDTAIPGVHVSDNAEALLQYLGYHNQAVNDERVLLLTRMPPGPAVTGGAHRWLTMVVFDAARPPDGIGWEVDTDGTLTTTADERRRLCVLGVRTAIDLLSLIALTGQPGPVPARGVPLIPEQRQAARRTTDGSPSAPRTVTAPRPARLTVLGPCRLSVNGTEVAIRRSAAWQILVLLATRADGVTARDLVEAVWPGLAPASISGRLYTTLSELRGRAKPLLGGRDLIMRRGDRYALDPAVVGVDLWRLHAAARTAAKTIATDARHHAQHDVIAAYTGELAAGHAWHWLAEPRDVVRRAVLDAYVDLAAGQPPTRTVELLTEALDVDPYNAHVHDLAVRALTEIGDHTAATRLQQTYHHRLSEAGLRPGAHYEVGSD